MPDRKRYRSERLQIMLDEAELSAIDNWRFDMKMPTRTAAVRELIRLGLHASEEGEDAHKPDLHSKSTDFPVVEDQPDKGGDDKITPLPGVKKTR